MATITLTPIRTGCATSAMIGGHEDAHQPALVVIQPGEGREVEQQRRGSGPQPSAILQGTGTDSVSGGWWWPRMLSVRAGRRSRPVQCRRFVPRHVSHAATVIARIPLMSTSRRHFLGAAAGASLAGELLAETPQSVSPNDRIRVALIGNGIQGSGDARTSLATGGVELVAVSDVYEGRLTRAKEVWGNSVFTTRDYREVLARPDVDAVIIATPDHWHRKIAIDAMNAGKDVYCEKPMVQLLDDGQEVIDTAEANRPHHAGGQPARQLHRLPEGQGTAGSAAPSAN